MFICIIGIMNGGSEVRGNNRYCCLYQTNR